MPFAPLHDRALVRCVGEDGDCIAMDVGPGDRVLFDNWPCSSIKVDG